MTLVRRITMWAIFVALLVAFALAAVHFCLEIDKLPV